MPPSPRAPRKPAPRADRAQRYETAGFSRPQIVSAARRRPAAGKIQSPPLSIFAAS